MVDDEYYESLDIPTKEKKNVEQPNVPSPTGLINENPEKNVDPTGGRPINSRDIQKRKTKRVLPKSSDSVATIWAYNAQKTISEIVTPMMLDFYNKKNVRSLTKNEFDQLEHLKLCLLTGIEPFIEITPEIISELINNGHRPNKQYYSEVDQQVKNFVYANNRKPTIDEIKYIYASVYTQLHNNEDN